MMHADHFNYDRAYSSKDLSFYICHVTECTFCMITAGHMVE